MIWRGGLSKQRQETKSRQQIEYLPFTLIAKQQL